MSSIGPYSSIAGFTPSLARALANSQDQLDDLSVQYATGKVSQSYAGLGDGRTTALAMRSKLQSIDSYDQTAATVTDRLSLMNLSVTRLNTLASDYSTVDSGSYQLTSAGTTVTQGQAGTDLKDAIAQLNTNINGRYLFSGRATDTKPVLSADEIMTDNSGKAGLRTVISERKLADLGADGRGRIDVSAATAGSFTATEQASGPYGMKITSLSSTLTNGVATGPTGTPPSITLGVTGQPNPDETVRVGLTLPDGSTEEIKLTAMAADDTSEPQNGQFRIGATADETAANMQAAFDTQLKKTADTALVAASAIQAGNDFFDASSKGEEPTRVAGFDGTYATDADRVAALQGATASDNTDTADKTVAWYQGDTSSTDPRKTAAATVSDGVSVSYGARADENGLRDVVKGLAVFSSMTFSTTDANGSARYSELATRLTSTLGATSTTKAIQTVSADLSMTSVAIKDAGTRSTATKAIAQDALARVENADTSEVAVKISALQSQLQASYTIAASLKDLTLVNFL